ncbi:MAG: hypothetical protein J0I12_02160 [Candidatus Eremiobacteraeota bacterium]|nr:hypothetical protein [Candidatus Eremiobacteraeota bacterium]
MKKNLLILALVLASVAVAARWTQDQGVNPEWERLREDEARCLEAMWGQKPQIEMVPAEGGLKMSIQLAFGVDISPLRRSWTYDVASLVAARHPQVQVVGLNVAGVSRISVTGRTELLRRQRQAIADQITPGTLVLLDLQTAPEPAPEMRVRNRVEAGHGASRRAPRQEAPLYDSARPVESMPAPTPEPNVTAICWLVTPTQPSPKLLEALNPLERVVKLPEG